MFRNFLRRQYLNFHQNRILINNHKIRINNELSKYFNIRRNNIYEEKISNFISFILSHGDTFLDIGANLGILSLEASNIVSNKGKVIAFEPNPYILHQISYLFDQNARHKNYFVFPIAVSDQNNIAELCISGDPIIMEKSYIKKASGSENINIICKSLDSVIDNNIAPDIIKIDVEGGEFEVLSGAVNTISRNKPYCIIEIHGFMHEDPESYIRKIFNFFHDLNFQSYNISNNTFEDNEAFIENHNRSSDNDDSELIKYYSNLIFFPKAKRQYIDNWCDHFYQIGHQ